MVIGLIRSPKNDKVYKKIIKDLGHDYKILDIEGKNWTNQLKKIDKMVDVYFWQSIDRGMYYRRDILDPVYFIENYSTHKIFPNFNQYYFYNDKIKQTNILNYHEVPIPKTFYTRQKEEALKYVQKTNYPFVLKDPHSASSLGVYLIKSKKQAKDFIEKIFSQQGMHSLFSQFYAQEFIPNLDKSLRIITIGNRVYSAYWRISQNDWRHRFHEKEGLVSHHNVPTKAKQICQRMAKKLKFHWMAWDILVDNNKIYIIEFSCNFGTQGAEKLGFKPKEEIIKYIENYA